MEREYARMGNAGICARNAAAIVCALTGGSDRGVKSVSHKKTQVTKQMSAMSTT